MAQSLPVSDEAGTARSAADLAKAFEDRDQSTLKHLFKVALGLTKCGEKVDCEKPWVTSGPSPECDLRALVNFLDRCLSAELTWYPRHHREAIGTWATWSVPYCQRSYWNPPKWFEAAKQWVAEHPFTRPLVLSCCDTSSTHADTPWPSSHNQPREAEGCFGPSLAFLCGTWALLLRTNVALSDASPAVPVMDFLGRYCLKYQDAVNMAPLETAKSFWGGLTGSVMKDPQLKTRVNALGKLAWGYVWAHIVALSLGANAFNPLFAIHAGLKPSHLMTQGAINTWTAVADQAAAATRRGPVLDGVAAALDALDPSCNWGLVLQQGVAAANGTGRYAVQMPFAAVPWLLHHKFELRADGTIARIPDLGPAPAQAQSPAPESVPEA